ncbi:MAG: hypothetical protein J7K53_08505 [Bacteroidales bacterium]|nr:hypothetical protein [Bacteroidales bacterium]
MKKLLFVLVLLSLTLIHLNAQTPQIEKLLDELPDVVFKKIDSTVTGITYELKIRQPLDHSEPSGYFFFQKVYLLHKGFNKPVVMNTAGYGRSRPYAFELTTLLDANQVDVEHRYFGDSQPDSLDYNYLNFEQVTADLHQVNELLKNIYSGKWISTGISKGGTTTIMYRYFYPDDVDVSVPYVAPINNALEDTRIYEFFDTIGTEACRNKIRSFQRRILEKRDEILPWLHFYAKGANNNFTYNTLEEAFEYAVLEYPFSFWQFGHRQYGTDCSTIPVDTTSLISCVEYLLDVAGISSFSDQDLAESGPYFYQAATEMGAYGYETEDFKDLLKVLPINPYPRFLFVPDHLPVSFDGTLLEKVDKWLKVRGNHFIYINGATDPWCATAVPPSENVDAEWFFLSGENHGGARIRNMNETEREKFISTLERWLDIEIENRLPAPVK